MENGVESMSLFWYKNNFEICAQLFVFYVLQEFLYQDKLLLLITFPKNFLKHCLNFIYEDPLATEWASKPSVRPQRFFKREVRMHAFFQQERDWELPLS